ncbi:SusC/RagA family TonB-linked outer membrane protein [Xanthovirga aplysinae]|uniref:SusC/RagA family TonB-linked outer membrane protein n=1 Tax=Xanthovirga aplysinae TaxID=2529853 RepID=UPI0012BC4809|nr:TonB-dependent receptor [Xanthovirga aplysinae]MTI31759.1 TonB-dependent receptor [Xanthovirga aplysinae]
MMKKLLICFILAPLFFTEVWSQSRSVSGRITSQEDGYGLPGVSVVLKGTTTGTQTDVGGKYSLEVPQKDGVLVFSFVGMATQEIEIGVRSTIDVIMASDVKQLSEVVITGYGAQSKEKLISSIAIVDASEIQDVAMPDITQIIQGKAPGVLITSPSGQPGSAQQIRIRGTGSISAGKGPLYVIDGVIVENGDFSTNTESTDVLAGLNPNDIESYSVLKDAAATSLYGSRGANGVILINTKSGKAGKTKFSFNFQQGITTPNLGNFVMMSSAEALQYERELLEAAGFSPEVILGARPDELALVDTDWVDEAFRQGVSRKYELSASGGTAKTVFFISGEYFQQDGVLIESSFERFSSRLNLKHTANEKLDFGMKFNTSYTKGLNATAGNRFSSPLLGAFVNSPFDPVRDPDTGELYVGDEPGRITFTGDNFVRSVPLNPVNNNNLRTIGNFNIGFNFLENLRLSSKIGVDFVSIKESDYFDSSTPDGEANGGSATNAYNENLTVTSQTMLTGNKTFGNVHNLDALAVFEASKTERSNFEAFGIGFANPLLKTLQSAALPQGVDGFNSAYSFLSYLGQLNYNYDNRYYFSTSIRRDGSSRFGANFRYANFYSFGASWRVSQEAFMNSISWLSDLKVRLSYGSSGNANIDNFASRGLYSYSVAYNGNPGGYPTQVDNPDLTWETTNIANLALDFGLFNDRVSGTIEVYRRVANDLLLEVPVSGTSGFSTYWDNIGSMENKGVEVLLSALPVKGDFSWNVDLNLSMNRNKVLELYNGEDINDYVRIIREGLPIRTFYMREWAGVNPDDGTPMWSDGEGGTTGDYNAAPELEVGNAEPNFTGGLTNSFSFKGIELSAFFYFAVGHEVYNDSRRFIESDGQRFGWSHLAAAADRWMKPGDVSERPQAIYGGNNQSNFESTRYLEDGSFLRLRNIQLAYNVPMRLIERLGLTNVKVYAQGQNLITLTEYTGFDPEMSEDGREWFRYPNGKSYTFGLNIGF